MSVENDNTLFAQLSNASKRFDDGTLKTAIRSKPGSQSASELTTVTNEQPRLTAGFSHLRSFQYDPNQEAFLVFPKTLLNTMEQVLKTVVMQEERRHHQDVEPTYDRNEGHFEQGDTQVSYETFINEYNELKLNLMENLKQYSEDDLRHEVDGSLFSEFKEYRKVLTKWYVSGQHLLNKLTNSNSSNQYLKLQMSVSPAIVDNGLKDTCCNRMQKAKASIENELTKNVVKRVYELNESIKAQFLVSKTQSAANTNKIMMKALRVVLRSNSRLKDHERITYRKNLTSYTSNRKRPRHDNHDKRTDRRERYQPRRHWNTRKSTRTVTDDDDEDYPPPKHQSHDYRRYKRREPDYNEEPTDNDDEVFYQNSHRQRFRKKSQPNNEWFSRPKRNVYYI